MFPTGYLHHYSILNELDIKRVKKHFNFLRFFFGKGLYCIFLGLICFNRHKWFSWACSILFFISAVFYILLGITFRRDEKAKLREIMNETPSSTNTSNEVRDVHVKQNFPDKFKL